MDTVSHFEEHERDIRRDFWTTLKRFAGQVPFVEDLVAAYYCALDPATPMRVRGILLAALAYFIVRWRYRPLTWLWRFPGLGFTDDAAVLYRPLRALIAHYSYSSRGSGESARQGDAQNLSTSVVLNFTEGAHVKRMSTFAP